MNPAALAFERPGTPGKWASLAATVAMHLLLVVVLVYGVRWQTAPPAPVQVELVSAASLEPTRPVVQPRPEPKPEPKIEPRPESKLEPKPVAKPDIAIKKEPEKPKPKVEPKPEPKPQPKPEPKPEVKPEPKKDSSLDKLLDREMSQVKQRNSALKVDQELAKLKSDQAVAAQGRAIASYMDKVSSKIRPKVEYPGERVGHPVALVSVVQLPSGEVLSVTVVNSTGIPALDTAIERAIFKASPLPKPEGGVPFNRELRLTFRPFDE